MLFLVLACKQYCSCHDDHHHVECVVCANWFACEGCICHAVLDSLLEDLEPLSGVPWFLRVLFVVLNLHLLFLSKCVVEMVEGDSETPVGVACQDLLIPELMCDWKDDEEALGESFVHILIFIVEILRRAPRILDEPCFQ